MPEQMHPLEAVLRLIDREAPGSWYPRRHARLTGDALEGLHYFLEFLWLDGLVQRGDSSPEDGPGVVLTDRGRQVLADPEMLQRLVEGRPLTEGDRGGIVRAAIMRPAKPVVMRALLLMILLTFGWTVWRAGENREVQGAFLSFSPGGGRVNLNVALGVNRLLERSGALSSLDLLQGEWWRLLTAAFLHVGILHLLMNSWVLYSAGRYVESMWGHGRFLVIYLIAAVGGNCLAVAMQPAVVLKAPGFEQVLALPLAGASGALCGLLGAEGVWFLLNRRYLPRAMLSRFYLAFFFNVALLVFLGWFSGVSNWGHGGGALFGAATALLLHVQRFGVGPRRWLAVAGLPLLLVAGWLVLDRERTTSPLWHAVELIDFEPFVAKVRGTMNDAIDALNEAVPIQKQHASRRDPEACEKVAAELEKVQGPLAALGAELEKIGPYRGEQAETARTTALEYVRARLEQVKLTAACLRAGEHCTRSDEKQIDQQQGIVQEWRKKFKDLRGHEP
jgi:rhomboid protease GluP